MATGPGGWRTPGTSRMEAAAWATPRGPRSLRTIAGLPGLSRAGVLAALLAAGCTKPCATSAASARDLRGARCERSCPARAEHARTAGGACTCAAGLDALHGACVTPAEAAAYCGPTATWSGSACVARACPGSAPDAASGACVPARTLRATVRAEHAAQEPREPNEPRERQRTAGEVPEDRTVGCHHGHALAVRDDHVTCLPDAALCARGSDAIGGACAPPPSCAVGEVATAGRCVALVTRGGAGDPFAIDVGAWATALLGADGGDGTAIACGPLAASPGAFGVVHGAHASARVAIDLRFPDNDVTRVVLRVSATDADTARPVPPAAARITRLAIESLAALLRALGGASSSATITRTILCPLDGGPPPIVSPSEPQRRDDAPDPED